MAVCVDDSGLLSAIFVGNERLTKSTRRFGPVHAATSFELQRYMDSREVKAIGRDALRRKAEAMSATSNTDVITGRILNKSSTFCMSPGPQLQTTRAGIVHAGCGPECLRPLACHSPHPPVALTWPPSLSEPAQPGFAHEKCRAEAQTGNVTVGLGA
jgi:hypothetical protein